MFRIASTGAFVAYWITLFLLTHMKPIETGVPGNDKLAHFVAYGILAFLFMLCLHVNGHRISRRWMLVTFALAITYGMLDEWSQMYVGRTCSFNDWIADAAGAAAGIFLFRQISQLRVQEPAADNQAS